MYCGCKVEFKRNSAPVTYTNRTPHLMQISTGICEYGEEGHGGEISFPYASN